MLLKLGRILGKNSTSVLIARAMIIGLALIFFAAVLFIHSDVTELSMDSPLLSTDELLWDIHVDDELVETAVTLPERIPVSTGQTVRIDTDIPDYVGKEFNSYFIRSGFVSFRIIMDGIEIEHFPSSRRYPAFLLGSDSFFQGYFNQLIGGHHLAIEYDFDSFLSFRGMYIEPVMIGSFSAIKEIQYRNFFDLYMNIVFYSITTIGILLVCILVRDARYRRILLSFSVLCFLIMIISITDNPAFGLAIKNQMMSSLMMMASYSLLAIFMLIYHRSTGHHTNIQSPLFCFVSFLPMIMFMMFTVATASPIYYTSTIADLTILFSIVAMLIVSFAVLNSHQKTRRNIYQDIGITLLSIFITMRSVFLFEFHLSDFGHLILGLLTYTSFLVVAISGSTNYMKSRKSFMRSKEIEVFAYHDLLSNCLNRRSYEDYIARINVDAQLGIISFDINGMKSINDGFGHMEGDRLIIHFGRVIQNEDLRNAKVFRTGGDEFVIILWTTDEEKIKGFMKTIKDKFALTAPYGATLSGGYAIKRCGEELSGALRKADTMMYEDKTNNRKESLFDIARRTTYEL